jgi:hypothetical protein
MAACVAALFTPAPSRVSARPAGVNASAPPTARGMSLTWNPGLIAYSWPSTAERRMKLPFWSWRTCTPGKLALMICAVSCGFDSSVPRPVFALAGQLVQLRHAGPVRQRVGGRRAASLAGDDVLDPVHHARGLVLRAEQRVGRRAGRQLPGALPHVVLEVDHLLRRHLPALVGLQDLRRHGCAAPATAPPTPGPGRALQRGAARQHHRARAHVGLVLLGLLGRHLAGGIGLVDGLQLAGRLLRLHLRHGLVEGARAVMPGSCTPPMVRGCAPWGRPPARRP